MCYVYALDFYKSICIYALYFQTCQLLKIVWYSTFRGDTQRHDICIAAQVFSCYVESVYSKKCFFVCFISNIRTNCGYLMLNDEQYRLKISIPHFSSANNGPQMITFQMLPDILPSRVHVAIYLWFDSDSSALQHVMVCCWIWQCTTASVCLNDECLLINDDQNSRCQYDFNTALVLRDRSAVKCGRFRSTCMSQHSQRSESAKHRLSSQIRAIPDRNFPPLCQKRP